MGEIDWGDPMTLTVLGILVFMLAISFIALVPVFIRGLLRLVVMVAIIIYSLQYTGIIRPILPSFQEIGEKTVRTTQHVTKKSKEYLKQHPQQTDHLDSESMKHKESSKDHQDKDSD